MKKILLLATMSLLTTGLMAKNLEFNTPQATLVTLSETVTAEFIGYDAELGGYHFTYLDDDNEGTSISFDKISEEALASFDLKSDSFIGKTFMISYDIKMIDVEADGESFQAETNSIISLELK